MLSLYMFSLKFVFTVDGISTHRDLHMPHVSEAHGVALCVSLTNDCA